MDNIMMIIYNQQQEIKQIHTYTLTLLHTHVSIVILGNGAEIYKRCLFHSRVVLVTSTNDTHFRDWPYV